MWFRSSEEKAEEFVEEDKPFFSWEIMVLGIPAVGGLGKGLRVGQE